MNRRTFLATGACAASSFAVTAVVHANDTSADVTLQTASGNIHGTLALPATLPAPMVLIIPGSGSVDRNGNAGALQGNTYALLATALAQAGFASVRYDKRGVGASAAAGPSESGLRFETYVDDALAWIRILRADKRFTTCVVAGHSEGSLIGMIAVQHATQGAFVSLEGAGRPAPAIIHEQLQGKVSSHLAAQADAIMAQLSRGHLVPNPPPELAFLFRESVQPYLISWFKYDPAAEIAKVGIPTTIVQGTADVQITMTDARALKKGRPGARLIVIDGMNHVLKHAPDISTAQAVAAGYENPLLPIDPRVVTAIAGAIR